MTKKITKLTPEQEQQIVVFREERRAIGLRTGHDAECAELGRAAVLDAYREIGHEPPQLVLWAQSPLQALLMRWALERVLPAGDQLRDQLGGQLWGQLVDQLGGQLRDQLGVQLVDQLWDQLGVQLVDQLWDQLRGQLWGQLVDQLGGQLRDQLGGQLVDQLWDQLQQCWSWGQCELGWLGFYRFGIMIGVSVTDEQERRLALWERLARAAYMVLSWSGVTILVQHPTVAAFDDRRRLHRTDGQALEFSDGYGVYAVRGVRLTPERGKQMAERSLTARQILDEPNAEVRRVLVDVYNAGDGGRWVRDLGAEPIHRDVDLMGRSRALFVIDQPGDEPWVGVQVTNSSTEPDGSRKVYGPFRCHPELRPLGDRGARHRDPQPQAMTCQNAVASGYGYCGHEYRPVLET